jgi:short subunit dehydrogenase-like uncharacterized protein
MRKLLVLLAITAMVALAGACGPSEDGGSSAKNPVEKGPPTPAEEPTTVETVQVAYKETAAEGTARTSFETTTTAPAADAQSTARAEPMTFTMRGRGVVDFSGAASSLTMEMPGMGGFEGRQVENTVYMKVPEEFAAQMFGAKPWVEVDLDAVAKQQTSVNLGQVQPGVAQDPTGKLEYLRGVSESVEKVGEEQVRGTQTTRYRATIDLKKAAAQEDSEARGAYDETIETLGASKLPVEVWLDDQNRIRRFAMDLTVPMPENAASPKASREDAKMRTRTVAEYYDFGAPVDVQAPPPDETMDGSKLLAGGQPAAQ